MVIIEDVVIPFIIPTITALIIFTTQWHKKGAEISISASDIKTIKEIIDEIDIKVNKMIDKMNTMTTDIEIFKYRLRTIEKQLDDMNGSSQSHQQAFRPKDSNGE